jgi:hypothetical protein
LFRRKFIPTKCMFLIEIFSITVSHFWNRIEWQ